MLIDRARARASPQRATARHAATPPHVPRLTARARDRPCRAPSHAQMGFFDKAKKFMGGHGAKVELTRIERQPASDAQMPLGDTVIKGNLEVTTDKDCVVLAHKFEMLCEYKDKEGVEHTHRLGSDAHVASTDIIGGDVKWPYDLAAGQTVKDSFLIHMEDDIPTQLGKLGFADAAAVVASGEVKFKLRVIADVKGSPFDPKSEAYVRIVP